MEMRVDVTDILEGATRLRGAPRIIDDELHRGMTRATSLLLREVITEVPVKTGALARSHEMKVTGAGGSLRGTVATHSPYARFVHDGRGPVVAKGRALRFVIGGRTLYRKRVGPAKANPYFKRAWQQSRAGILKEFAAVLPRVTKRLGL